MQIRNVGVLFGGVSPEHAVSLRSARCVLGNLDTQRWKAWPIGITRSGAWVLYGSDNYDALPDGSWERCPDNRTACISPSRDQGLLVFGPQGVEAVHLDVVFPVLHGENGEDGSVQGLLQLAGIPCVGPGVCASAAAMDKTLTKLVADRAHIPQAEWIPVRTEDLPQRFDEIRDEIEARWGYPVFVKPAGTGSSVGVSKAKDASGLLEALKTAAEFDSKILIERFVPGREIEVAVLGNRQPVASVCGEIDSGVEFYDYSAKYITDTSRSYIPARISPQAADTARALAVRIYRELGCRGLSRADFFVGSDDTVTFNEINTIPGFTSISMYPKLFAAEGLTVCELITRLLELAMEE